MPVTAYREVIPRTFSHRFGESPTAEIKYHLTTDGPVTTQEALNTVGIFHGTPHPEYGYLLCNEGALTELDRFHVEVTYSYSVPAIGTQDSDPNPLARADIWSFSTGGAAVPALACTGSATAVGSGWSDGTAPPRARAMVARRTPLKRAMRCMSS